MQTLNSYGFVIFASQLFRKPKQYLKKVFLKKKWDFPTSFSPSMVFSSALSLVPHIRVASQLLERIDYDSISSTVLSWVEILF